MTFVDPIGSGFKQGRVDAGVDYTGSGPLYALGSGTITSISNSGWPGAHAFIAIKLDDTSGLSDYIYYAEDINPSVQVGERVSAGQQIGTATGGSTGIEVGWAAAPGTGNPLGTGAFPTSAGTNMFNLIKSLGGIGGTGTGQGNNNNSSGGTSNLGTSAVNGIANVFGVKSLKDVAIRAGLLLLGVVLLYQGLKLAFTSSPTFKEAKSDVKQVKEIRERRNTAQERVTAEESRISTRHERETEAQRKAVAKIDKEEDRKEEKQ